MEYLSLATFVPANAVPPYLNTPRSLEACRINGVNPIELVEIPITDYQKSFPNDADAAQRRFERIDGARRRILEQVKKDWVQLCQSGWKPPKTGPVSTGVPKESIIQVPDEAHCTLLEIQAAKFRKIELDQFIELQRMLKIQLKKADEEVRHKKIIEKHEEIQNSNDNSKQERALKRESMAKEQFERQLRKEEEAESELRRLRAIDAQYASQKKIEDKERAAREKQNRERLEFERLQREEQARQMKDSILRGLEDKVTSKKKIQELRDKQTVERLNDVNATRRREMEERQKAMELKAAKAKEEAIKKDEFERQEIARRLKENEEYRRKVQEVRDARKKEISEVTKGNMNDKLNKIREDNDNTTNEKIQKTLKELEEKERLAKVERDKILEAQNRRKLYKSIREESFRIAAMRKKKADDYRISKLERDIKEKEERCAAIKKGFQALNQMRAGIKDIMVKTNLELKAELGRLQHDDEFSPDKVVMKAITVSNDVLFPSLKKMFGVAGEGMNGAATAPAGSVFMKTNESFRDEDETPSAVDILSLNEPPAAAMKLSKSMNSLSSPHSRTNFSTLPMKSLTQEKLVAAVRESKKLIDEQQHESKSPTEGRRRSRTKHQSDHHDGGGSRKPSRSQGYSSSGSPSRGDMQERADDSVEDYLDYHPRTEQRSQPSVTIPRDLIGSNDSRSKGSSSHRNKLPSLSHTPLNMEDDDDSPTSKGQQLSSKSLKKSMCRTDLNEKAKFLATPPGRFRREFSMDHPLAPGGKGKYKTELSCGKLPTGLGLEIEKMDRNVSTTPSSKNNRSSRGASASFSFDAVVAEDLNNTADTIKRLTYQAQSKVVDHHEKIKRLKEEQNALILKLLDEERKHEDERRETSMMIKDEGERKKLEEIFATERRIASERILEMTKYHEQEMKQAILNSMNLGKTS